MKSFIPKPDMYYIIPVVPNLKSCSVQSHYLKYFDLVSEGCRVLINSKSNFVIIGVKWYTSDFIIKLFTSASLLYLSNIAD